MTNDPKPCAGRACGTTDGQHSDACKGDYVAHSTGLNDLLEAHHADDLNRHLKILPSKILSSEGAPTGYRIKGFNTETAPKRLCDEIPDTFVDIEFQHGNPVTTGVHGLTNEVLIAVLMHRLAAFQMGSFACDENARALHHLDEALKALQARQP